VSLQPISRRSALSGFAISLVGGLAGFVVARTSGVTTRKSSTTAANGYGAAPAGGGKLLAALGRVPPGGGLILANEKIVLTAATDGTVHGFSAVCTHQGCTVGSVSAGVISCPCHGSSFDAVTGAVIAGPASQPLPAISIVVRNNDIYTQ
jgi:Rieske Fe-S protein